MKDVIPFVEKRFRVLASSVVTQLQGGKYVTIFPKERATAAVVLPYKKAPKPAQKRTIARDTRALAAAR